MQKGYHNTFIPSCLHKLIQNRVLNAAEGIYNIENDKITHR